MLPCFPVLCAPKAVTITANSLLIHCQYSYSYSSSYYSYSYYCVQHSLKHTCNARMRRASSLLIADLAARRSTLASTVQYSSANAALINVENSGNKQTAQFGLPGSSGHMDCTDKGVGGRVAAKRVAAARVWRWREEQGLKTGLNGCPQIVKRQTGHITAHSRMAARLPLPRGGHPPSPIQTQSYLWY